MGTYRGVRLAVLGDIGLCDSLPELLLFLMPLLPSHELLLVLLVVV
jgi:hypothetical protein